MSDMISAGKEIDSYCTRCRLTLDHIIVALADGAIVKVKCKTCGSIHRFRGAPAVRSKPRERQDAGQKASARTLTDWETAVEEAKGPELPYDMERSYHAGDLIVHGVFGKGVVQKPLFKKCSVLFRDKERVLATANT